MDGSTHRSDADRESSELRARTYGPDPNIGADPATLARLHELEAAHGADLERRGDSPTSESSAVTDASPTVAPDDPPPSTAAEKARMRSLWQRATATWWSRVAWVASALVVTFAVVATVVLVSAPRPPDTSLHPTGAEPDDQIRRLMGGEGSWVEIDFSTLRAYGSYLGLEIWSGTNAFGSPCLVAVHRANDVLSEARCAPSPAELIMDVSSSGDEFEGFDGVAGDGIVRFILRGDTVDAYVHIMPGTD